MEMAIIFVFRALHGGVLCFFSVDAFFMEKIAKQNHLFSKKSKQAILFRDFLHEKCINRKNRVHHDEEHGKMKKMAVSNFSVDPQKVV